MLKPGGRLAVAVCSAVEQSPGYAVFADLLDRLFGRDVGDAFRAPFVLGDPDELSRLAVASGIDDAVVQEQGHLVRFDSIRDLVAAEHACVWSLGGVLDQDQFATLLTAAEDAFANFVGEDGRVRFDMPALILTAGKSS